MADPRPGDPADRVTDAKADGAFGGLTNHRSGYGVIELDGRTYTKLEWVERFARAGGTLAAGEGKMLVEELDRLRAILAALREPSDAMQNNVCGAYFSSWDSQDIWTVVIHAAVAFAEQEVGRE